MPVAIQTLNGPINLHLVIHLNGHRGEVNLLRGMAGFDPVLLDQGGSLIVPQKPHHFFDNVEVARRTKHALLLREERGCIEASLACNRRHRK